MRGIRANMKRSNQDASQYTKEAESNNRVYFTIQNENEAENENDYCQEKTQYYHRNPNFINKDKADGTKPAQIYRMENESIQNEARGLVEKTKKMIDGLSKKGEIRQSSIVKSKSKEKKLQHRIINYEDAIRIKSRSPSPNNETRGVMEKYNNSLLNSETNLKNYLNMNNSTLQERLLEKIKLLKYLEKELKEKNSIIKNLHSRIDKQNEEIMKFNDILTVERTSNYKVEISNLNRKHKEKEKIIEENKVMFDNIITEFKLKISNLIAFNDSATTKIEELEHFNNELKSQLEQHKSIYRVLEDHTTNAIESHRQDVEKHFEENKQISQLKKKLKTMLHLIFDVFRAQDNFSESIESTIIKANSFFDSSIYNSTVEKKPSSFYFNYATPTNHNIESLYSGSMCSTDKVGSFKTADMTSQIDFGYSKDFSAECNRMHVKI